MRPPLILHIYFLMGENLTCNTGSSSWSWCWPRTSPAWCTGTSLLTCSAETSWRKLCNCSKSWIRSGHGELQAPNKPEKFRKTLKWNYLTSFSKKIIYLKKSWKLIRKIQSWYSVISEGQLISNIAITRNVRGGRIPARDSELNPLWPGVLDPGFFGAFLCRLGSMLNHI